jgi:hypothetical protein
LDDSFPAKNDVLRAKDVGFSRNLVAGVGFDVFALDLFWWHGWLVVATKSQ